MCDKTTRAYMLAVAAGLYEHAVADAAMRDALDDHGVELTLDAIRAEYYYLSQLTVDGRPAVILSKNGGHDMWAIRVTPAGVDLLTGAAEAPGVRAADPRRENLAFTRDLRRGILATLNERRGKWLDDLDILEHFEREGFVNITRAELQFQLWYLAEKGFIERHEITLLGARNWRARITLSGVDLTGGAITDVGVTSDGR